VIIGVGMINNRNGIKYLNFIRCPPNHAIISLSSMVNLFSAWT